MSMLWTILGISATIAYTAIYFKYYVNFPEVHCKKNTTFYKLINNRLPTVKKRYWAYYWCYESRAITLARQVVYPFYRHIKFAKEECEAKDGGYFTIDWAGTYNKTCKAVIVLVPGLTSHRNSSYVYTIITRLVDAGYIVALVNHRGVDEMKLKTSKTYCATHTVDLEATVRLVKQRYTNATIIGVGASLGAMIMAQYLEERGSDCDLTAAVLFSCPFHPIVNCRRLEHPLNFLLINRPVTNSLKQNYSKHRHLFEGKVDHEAVMNSVGIKDFDDAFTAPVFGYTSSDHYYEHCRVGKERLKAIRRPTLCVNADDDMFSEEATLPKTDISETDYVAMVMTKGGGHVSHMQGFLPFGKSFFEDVLLEYIEAITS